MSSCITPTMMIVPEGVDPQRLVMIADCIAELGVIDAKLREMELLRARRATVEHALLELALAGRVGSTNG